MCRDNGNSVFAIIAKLDWASRHQKRYAVRLTTNSSAGVNESYRFFFASLIFFQAIDGTYIDNKCPFTGNVRIRGRILTGTVQKLKMQRTIVIRRDYLHYVRKYSRFEKRHKNMSVHLSPAFRFVSIILFPQSSTARSPHRIFVLTMMFLPITTVFRLHIC